jgi:trehalose 6-phosphate synthase
LPLQEGDGQEMLLVTVSNRLPVTGTSRRWRVSAGGLVTALRPVMERRRGLWIGWDGGLEDLPGRVEGINAELYGISLSRSQIQDYYHGFSNRTLWPLFHDLVQTPVFDTRWWASYLEVNERFAQATLAASKASGNTIWWIHDYHLLLLPELIRRARGQERVGFFLHTPWPPPELFSRLPWRADLLRGVLGADVISFHTERYRKNFVRTCARVLEEVTVRGKTILLGNGRRVQTMSNPISIDAGEFAQGARSPEVDRETERLRRQFDGRRLFVGVDRLDYTKGILERLTAFERLLERRNDLRRELAFVQIAVPSRGNVREYRELRSAIEQAIGRINGRFTEPGSDVPIHYLHRGVSMHKLLAYYRAADIFVITALKDGMNLVSKEYVVTQAATGGDGVLVLSEFTGAALELTRALSCNPFDVEGLSHVLENALEIHSSDRRRAIRSMAAYVERHDVFRWVDTELRAIESAVRKP